MYASVLCTSTSTNLAAFAQLGPHVEITYFVFSAGMCIATPEDFPTGGIRRKHSGECLLLQLVIRVGFLLLLMDLLSAGAHLIARVVLAKHALCEEEGST